MFFTLDLHSLGFLDEALLSAVGGPLVYLLSVEHIYWLFKSAPCVFERPVGGELGVVTSFPGSRENH